jgi:hypothetical protein
MFARAIRLALLVGPLSIGSAGACGGGQTGVSDEDRTDKTRKKKKHRKHAPDKEAISEDGKSWGGWRWKGDRDDCFYVFKNKCFESKSRACEAAKCGSGECSVKSGAPSKVTCKK